MRLIHFIIIRNCVLGKMLDNKIWSWYYSIESNLNESNLFVNLKKKKESYSPSWHFSLREYGLADKIGF